MTVPADSHCFDWTQFWTNPAHATSFLEGPLVASYDHAELKVWFDSLLNSLHDGDRALDLCCGNGAATAGLLAAADRRSLDIQVAAIDAARVQPPRHLTDRATFHECPAERLPFEDETFAVVVSCFGLEFCSYEIALREIRRVLRPGGEVACLMYAIESPLITKYLTFLRVYNQGLGRLLDAVIKATSHEVLYASSSERLALTSDLRRFIDDDVPQPVYREQLHAMIDSVLAVERLQEDLSAQTDDRRHDLAVLEQLSQSFGLMRAACTAALPAVDPQQLGDVVELIGANSRSTSASSMTARQLVRVADSVGFDDTCVIPFRFRGPLFGWLLTGVRP